MAVHDSRAVGDPRTEAFALGTLGHLYETQQQWEEAQSPSQALVLRVGRQHIAPAQQIYNWVLRLAAADLATSGVDTLVFVLDDLATQTMTKAEALSNAQLKVLKEPQFRKHPFY